jgi:hypothetical protein
MSRRNWIADKRRALRRRAAVKAMHNEPFMAPLLPKKPRQPPSPSKAELRDAAAAALAEWQKKRATEPRE